MRPDADIGADPAHADSEVLVHARVPGEYGKFPYNRDRH
jgi:hypothetical protein